MFIFSPDFTVAPQANKIEIDLSDGVNTNKLYFTFTVINKPAYFSPILAAKSAKVGASITYVLPNYIDDEGANVTFAFVST